MDAQGHPPHFLCKEPIYFPRGADLPRRDPDQRYDESNCAVLTSATCEKAWGKFPS